MYCKISSGVTNQASRPSQRWETYTTEAIQLFKGINPGEKLELTVACVISNIWKCVCVCNVLWCSNTNQTTTKSGVSGRRENNKAPEGFGKERWHTGNRCESQSRGRSKQAKTVTLLEDAGRAKYSPFQKSKPKIKPNRQRYKGGRPRFKIGKQAQVNIPNRI